MFDINKQLHKDMLDIFYISDYKTQFRIPVSDDYNFNKIHFENLGIQTDNEKTFGVFYDSKIPLNDKEEQKILIPLDLVVGDILTITKNSFDEPKMKIKVTDIKIQRLNDISEEELKKEQIEDIENTHCDRCNGTGFIGTYDRQTLGYEEIDCPDCIDDINRFKFYWNDIYENKYSDNGLLWENNPFVWVISVQKISD